MIHRNGCSLLLLVASLAAQSRPAVDPSGVPGTRLIVGGGKLPEGLRARFVELAGGEQARIVLIATASASADDAAAQEKSRAEWQQEFPKATFTLLHTRDRAVADTEAFAAPLANATGVWFGGGDQQRLADAYLGTRVEQAFHALLARGGVVAGTSAGAAIQSRTMIAGGNPVPVVAQGFDFLPDGIVDQHFLKRNRLPRLLAALAAHPGHFGLGIDEGTAVEVRGRSLAVLGASKAVLVLAAAAGRAERIVQLQAGERADLVTWQRAARDRALAPWPPAPMRAPNVEHGTLVIVGGGSVPDAVVERFVAAAGGKTAKVVLVPTALERMPRGEDPFAARLRKAGAVLVTSFHWEHPGKASAEALAVLKDATGVWFGGGRQWRLWDAYHGTGAIAAFAAVLARGGVIGGTSAGATIQGEFLVRGNPLGNAEEWCEGYDQGFAFLPGVAIDQHFVRRNRTADLQGLVARLPQLIGLGIDEGTAVIVHGAVGEVVGASKVAVFDVRKAGDEARKTPAPVWLEAGARWDFAAGALAK